MAWTRRYSALIFLDFTFHGGNWEGVEVQSHDI
jgi:hypothetical protein